MALTHVKKDETLETETPENTNIILVNNDNWIRYWAHNVLFLLIKIKETNIRGSLIFS